MTTRDAMATELAELSTQFISLVELARDPQRLPLFVAEYQRWYTRALSLISLLGRDRLEEFQGYYLADPRRRAIDHSTYSIQDYMLAVRSDSHPKFDVHQAVVARLTAQISILQSLESRLEGVLADVAGQILAELEDSQIAAARELLRISPRAAGALAGAVLLTHLGRVARHHGLKISIRRPTVSHLNDLLKESRIYDASNWRSIQGLDDLRSSCLKQKGSEPETETVEDLIARVDSIVKTVV